MTNVNERDQMRQFFAESWRKYRENLLLEPVESMLAQIILLHPEYQKIFDHPEELTQQESHPFLHMSLHLAIREQINADRPAGIKAIYANLCQKFQDSHLAEHCMLEILEQVLWEAQQTGKLPDEKNYLEKLRKAT